MGDVARVELASAQLRVQVLPALGGRISSVFDIAGDREWLWRNPGLGTYPCALGAGTRAAAIYGCDRIDERHRHRFEVNNEYRGRLEAAGLVLSGLSPDENLVEIVEIPDHPWFVACQFHPEFKSRPTDCHPLFRGFIRAALERRAQREKAPRLSAVK